MTEYELFLQNIPLIAEMIVEARKLDDVSYEEWKNETLNGSREAVRIFAEKVLHVIDKYR